MTTDTLSLFITDAIDKGINQERLHIASGLRFDEFRFHHQHMTFTAEQESAIIREIKYWKQNK